MFSVEEFVSYAKKKLGKYYRSYAVERYNGWKYIIIFVRKDIPYKFGNVVYNELNRYRPRGYMFAMLTEE